MSENEEEYEEEIEGEEEEEFDDTPQRAAGDDSILTALSRQWGNTPWYLSSLGIHLFILVLMLLFAPAPREPKPPVINVQGDMESLPLEEETKVDETPAEVNDSEETQTDVTVDSSISISTNVDISEVVVEVEAADDGVSDTTTFDTMGAGDSAPVLQVAGGGRPASARTFTSRTNKSQKNRSLTKYGGDKYSEKSLERGLSWLARHQKGDGSWDMVPINPTKTKQLQTNAGITSLCMLALLGSGNTVDTGKYQRIVRKAEDFLLNLKYTDGGRSLPAPLAYEAPLMLMALAESYGMGSGNRNLKKKVEDLISMGVEKQLPNGGFPETALDRDGSWHNTTWWLSAMKSARQSGFKVPDSLFDRSFTEMFRCIEFEAGGEAKVEAGSKLFANIMEKPGSPRIEGGTASKMVISMAVFLLNHVRGMGLEDDRIRGMCNLMAVSGTNRNGLWEWPGTNVEIYDKFATRWMYMPDMFAKAGSFASVKREPWTMGSMFPVAAAGYPGALWGKPTFPEKFELASQGDRLSVRQRWYGACYWYWQGYSYSRLGANSDYWKAWNNNFKPYLIYTQAQGKDWPMTVTVDVGLRSRLETGDVDGSWPGFFLSNGCEPFDEMGQAAATAFSCMMLEVYYRF